MNESQFLFVCCQAGAEQALKDELARNRPELRFAYSRPGFVTFKLPPESAAGDYAELPSVFARTHGFSPGKVQGFDAAKLAEQAWELVASHPAIGKPVDLAVIATPAATVPGIIQQCGEAGTQNAIVLSAGFGEGGSPGGNLAAKLESAARRAVAIR